METDKKKASACVSLTVFCFSFNETNLRHGSRPAPFLYMVEPGFLLP